MSVTLSIPALVLLALLSSCVKAPEKVAFKGSSEQNDDDSMPDDTTTVGGDDDEPTEIDTEPTQENMDPLDDATEPKAFQALTWPQGQVLPSFPAPASMQDHFILREESKVLDVKSAAFQHKLGKADADGWIANKGDGEGHMIYGPNISRLPIGGNEAEFRLKRSGDAGDYDVLAVVDVYNSTTGTLLIEKKITGKDLPISNDFTSFRLPFKFSKYDDKIETRVFFSNRATIKVASVSIQRNQSTEELVLFASLKGIVNRQQPRLFSYEGDAYAEGAFTWLKSVNVAYVEVKDKWTLISKYKKELSGLIIYDPDVPDSLNLATTVALSKRGLIASPALAEILTKAPYNFPVIESYRDKFANKVEVYQYMLDKVWPTLSHRLVIGINPQGVLASLREYAVATGVATFYLDPIIEAESKLLNSFLGGMEKGSPYLGWWPEEEAGIARASEYGVMTIASDFSSNLTFHSGLPRDFVIKKTPDKPKLQNKIYVGFILSDGDNLQYIEHLMRKLWNNPDRGKVPMGWTMSPATIDAMPGALSYYYKTATDNDNLISGPSGLGYVFPNNWKDKDALKAFVQHTETYIRKAGFKVITIWNTVVGATNADTGKIYGENAPSLLGLTSQNTGGGLTVFPNQLPSMALACNYCTSAQAMIDHVKNGSKGWNGNEPRFLMIQAQPWTDVTPSSFLKVKESLGPEYVVVRPDHFFMLLRESKGLKSAE